MVINGDCCCFSGAKRGEWWNDHPIPPFPTIRMARRISDLMIPQWIRMRFRKGIAG